MLPLPHLIQQPWQFFCRDELRLLSRFRVCLNKAMNIRYVLKCPWMYWPTQNELSGILITIRYNLCVHSGTTRVAYPDVVASLGGSVPMKHVALVARVALCEVSHHAPVLQQMVYKQLAYQHTILRLVAMSAKLFKLLTHVDICQTIRQIVFFKIKT